MNKTRLDSLNGELQEIWKNFLSNDRSELHPVYFRALTPSPIVFVGMNPSFNEKGLIKTVKNTELEGLNVREYFRLSNDKFDVDISNRLNELSEEKYLTFFKQHKALATYLGLHKCNWSHIDLFQYRQTNQTEFLQRILKRDKTLNEFGQAQFDLFMKALVLLEPKIVIIINATAAKIFMGQIEGVTYTKVKSPPTGIFNYELNGKNIPIFLSGMLTGGRALDIFSRERLFWHVERVFKSQQSPLS